MDVTVAETTPAPAISVDTKAVIRCKKCQLNQFMTRQGNCRRCRRPLLCEEPAVIVPEFQPAQSAGRSASVDRHGDGDLAAALGARNVTARHGKENGHRAHLHQQAGRQSLRAVAAANSTHRGHSGGLGVLPGRAGDDAQPVGSRLYFERCLIGRVRTRRAWFFVPTSANGGQMWGTPESNASAEDVGHQPVSYPFRRLTLFSTRL